MSVRALRDWREEGIDIEDEEAVMRRAAQVRDREENAEDFNAVKLRKLRAEADLKEHELQVERGRYVSHESQRAAGMKLGLVIKGTYLKMDSELTPRLAGRSAAECTKILRAYAREKLTELSLYGGDIAISAD